MGIGCHRGRTGAGGRRGSACSRGLGEHSRPLPDYSLFHADVREGLFTGLKCAKGCPTPLLVTVDGHPGRFAHTILRDGDLCAVVCTVEGRAWRDRSSGKWHGRLTFVPLRIRVHGQNDRSAMDAELEIDLSGTDGHGGDGVDDFGEGAADNDHEVSSGART
ncbi:BZ3500_MvSof-1268-A1-R1_Chr12-2g03759 [Microbotryum saponariae]|uniref:BZ3500_MvSof-1268-A1-R1_Chr12-2g03759 protein n=1 Tax=Microbotryum saponariae TaxID=289078 RepID=A0A2X0MQP3_9BASI|nr:BZ3500_MvSof-1268-A1-R1_Chr12-2g03759 [Microbotryum saponariae]